MSYISYVNDFQKLKPWVSIDHSEQKHTSWTSYIQEGLLRYVPDRTRIQNLYNYCVAWLPITGAVHV